MYCQGSELDFLGKLGLEASLVLEQISLAFIGQASVTAL